MFIVYLLNSVSVTLLKINQALIDEQSYISRVEPDIVLVAGNKQHQQMHDWSVGLGLGITVEVKKKYSFES